MTKSLDSELLVAIATAEDPLTSERWASLLREHRIHVAVWPHGIAPVDLLSQGAFAWWELRVPESEVDRARELLAVDLDESGIAGGPPS